MKGASAVTAMFAALLCVGCSDRGSPACPHRSARTACRPIRPPANLRAKGASVSPTPAAATVPFKGTLEGSQTIEDVGLKIWNHLGSATWRWSTITAPFP